jgi:putative SOS response-associated peptidase YedK
MDKPFFREAFLKRRCLMPASAWYEFRGARGRKQSYCFHRPEFALLSFAGVWESHVAPDSGEVIESFAILTTTPNAQAATVHDRMPVVLAREDYARWLDPRVRDPDKLFDLLRPYAGELVVYQTTGYGNDPRHEGPECIEPIGPGLFD